MPAGPPHGAAPTRGRAVSILCGVWTSFICDTYIALTRNNKMKSGPGARSAPPRVSHTPRKADGKASKVSQPRAEVGSQEGLDPPLLGCTVFIDPLCCGSSALA